MYINLNKIESLYKVMSVNSKYVVGNLYVKCVFTKEHYQMDALFSLRKALRTLFGDGYDISSMPLTITVPKGSDFVEIDEALTQEFKKYPALKGMRFQLQMCRDMLIVQ